MAELKGEILEEPLKTFLPRSQLDASRHSPILGLKAEAAKAINPRGHKFDFSVMTAVKRKQAYGGRPRSLLELARAKSF